MKYGISLKSQANSPKLQAISPVRLSICWRLHYQSHTPTAYKCFQGHHKMSDCLFLRHGSVGLQEICDPNLSINSTNLSRAHTHTHMRTCTYIHTWAYTHDACTRQIKLCKYLMRNDFKFEETISPLHWWMKVDGIRLHVRQNLLTSR